MNTGVDNHNLVYWDRGDVNLIPQAKVSWKIQKKDQDSAERWTPCDTKIERKNTTSKTKMEQG